MNFLTQSCACVLVLFLAVATSNAQFELHPRLGTTIDTVERTYFNLFPRVRGFLSASTVQRGNGVTEFIISRDDNALVSDTIIRSDSTQLLELYAYIERYELSRRSRRSAKHTVKWELLQDLAAHGEIIESPAAPRRPVTLVSKAGVESEPRLIYASDSALYVCFDEDVPTIDQLRARTQRVPLSSIKELHVDHFGDFWLGAAIGTVVGLVGGTAIAAIASSSGHHDTRLFGSSPYVTISLVTLSTALLYGMLGHALDRDVDLDEGFTEEEWLEKLPDVRRDVMYPEFPPPELQPLIASP